MSVRTELAGLQGKWTGTSRLHTGRLPEKIYECTSTASVELRVKGQFLAVEYSWEFDERPQEGVLIVGCDVDSDAVQAIWTDSWHMSHKFMICDGTIDGNGNLNLRGDHPVAEEAGGWRIEIFPGPERFNLRMYNVSPEGNEEIAVEKDYRRE